MPQLHHHINIAPCVQKLLRDVRHGFTVKILVPFLLHRPPHSSGAERAEDFGADVSLASSASFSSEDGWDYTIYHSDYSVMDGGQLDAPELTIQEAREQILEARHMEKGRRLLQGYDAVMDKVAEAEELSADHRPSTLEKLAELASDTAAPKSPARSAPEL